jgi:hypothetical protein
VREENGKLNSDNIIFEHEGVLMTEDWTFLLLTIIAVAVLICITCLYAKARELKLIRDRHKLKVYQEFFHAVTDLNTAGTDPDRLGRAKMRLAYILDNMNIVAGPQVLKTAIEFLDFLNQCPDGDYDVLKELNILNTIVRAMRNDLDHRGARELDEAEFRFRFFIPKTR